MSETAYDIAPANGSHPPVMHDEQLLEFVPGAVYVCDTDGVVVRYNKRAGELWGRYPTPGDPKELYCGSHRLYRANGDLMPHNETPMVDALRQGNSYRNLEVQVERPDGNKIWILVNIDPLRNETGEIVGVINCFQDITDRKLADVRQKLLVNELNHRVKNTLATVQAIAAHTFRGGVSAEASKGFEGRLMALSRAHDVLTRESWEGANLKDVVDEVMAPVAGTGRLTIGGPDVTLEPKFALSMSIAIHELCTNAAKYGALSNTTGRVEVSWSVLAESTTRTLKFAWQEADGPAVRAPDHRGFGTSVIERTLTREHDAEVKLDFFPTGVRCEILAPLA
ncbi:sensor histidine kinase [Mesorhizobium sp. CO1-1-8]|uniref:sensor histidine kinase n=1 Tax=Mesorhizobium sp. CO1-1-8 TaxID=2876631 RepID=UPI001CD110E6|nr:sensor histidine kinase [Mesorhizobium sp. CO1-1-8]MBZ9774999.1 PAS domain-containing protein [Mesorhizobium sp. CO1-1-8]